MSTPTKSQTVAAFTVLRRFADESGYGGFISNERLEKIAVDISVAVVKAGSGEKVTR